MDFLLSLREKENLFSPWGSLLGDDYVKSIINVSGIGDGSLWALGHSPINSHIPIQVRCLVELLQQSSYIRYQDLFTRYGKNRKYPPTSSCNLLDYFKFFLDLMMSTNNQDGSYELQILLHFAKGNRNTKMEIIKYLEANTPKKNELTRLILTDLNNGNPLVVVDSNGRLNIKYANYTTRKKMNVTTRTLKKNYRSHSKSKYKISTGNNNLKKSRITTTRIN